MECINNIIKLSRTECECYDDDKPEDFAEGKAPVYLDELEGLNLDLVKSISDCAQGGLWDLMNRSRENAIIQFKTDLLSSVASNYMPERNIFKGLIGNTAFNSTLNISNDMAGLKLRTNGIIGGYMTLNRFGLMFNTTATFNIKVYSSDDLTTPVATFPVTSAANTLQYVILTDPLKLPLWSNLTSVVEYYFVYDLVGTYAPKNNKAACDCVKQNVAYKNWITPTGIKGNNSQDFTSFFGTTEFNGLALDVEFNCDSTRLICSDDRPLDFENSDPRAMNMAYAVRFKAGEMLIESILSSGEVNRYTMMDREALYGKRNRYRKLYEDWIVWLSENTTVLNSDCLMCRPNSHVSKGTIFA